MTNTHTHTHTHTQHKLTPSPFHKKAHFDFVVLGKLRRERDLPHFGRLCRERTLRCEGVRAAGGRTEVSEDGGNWGEDGRTII